MERKEKLKKWFKDPHNLIFLAILIFAFAIRWYYFLLTKTQPLWWDEAAYGALAKNFIHHAWDQTSLIIGETIIRPPLFPLLWSFLLRIGIDEIGTRLLLEFIPSILTVYLVYLTGKEMYNKKVGLIAMFVFSSLWIHLFYTGRLLTSVPALPFLFASVYFFFKSTKENFNPKLFGIAILLLSLSTLMRYPNGIVFFAFLAFILITQKLSIFTKKKFWIAGIIGILPLLLFFSFNYFTAGNIFPAFLSGDDYAEAEVAKPFAFDIVKYIPIYLGTAFLIFFILGAVISILEIGLGYDLIRKRPRLKSHILLLLILIFIYGYFMFYIRGVEDRWLFATALPLVCLVGVGLMSAHKFIKKHSKLVAALLILIILALGTHHQITFADPLIKSKKESFLQVRQGFEWIKENTPEDSIILGQGIEVYSLFYAERFYERLPPNVSAVDDIEADYLVAHIFAGQPPYLENYLSANQNKWQPVQAFFFDPQRTQAALVIYKRV